jgi:imidazole glycerol-phosphate synthase subunit HisH
MSERLVLIDYGSGNLRSAAKALTRAAQSLSHEVQVVISNQAEEVAKADRIVLPGVGAFGACAAALRALPEVWSSLEHRVVAQGIPFLGICVGMQLMAEQGHEHGSHDGLGWIGGDVVRLTPHDPSFKVPHMGWNTLGNLRPHPVVQSLDTNASAYFVHSYHFIAKNPAHILAQTDYDMPIAAILGKDNMLGTQFHPEKSQAVGLAFLQAFLEWHP